jgi:DNA (cytosine-5)-methyltransferase 1
MRCGHLFNGIGGFALAATWMGWENVFHCEIDDFCNKVMKKHFPNSIEHGDIKREDFSSYRATIDLITGGEPCQPHSSQGSKLGEGDHRYLWPEYYRSIGACRPAWCVNENVEGTIGNGILDRKIQDLEAIGYTCWPPLIIPAGAVGALHKRNRVWLVAYSDGDRLQEIHTPSITKERRDQNLSSGLVKGERWDPADKRDLLRAAHGLPRELDKTNRIKALGNGIDPYCAYEIFKAIEAFENQQ